MLQRFTSPIMKSSLTFSEEKFLKEFNLPQVDFYLKRKDITTAKKALFNHYRERSIPKWLPFPSRMSNVYEISESELIKKADHLLSHRFPIGNKPEICFGEKIDWKFNPTSDPRARWTRELNRHLWWSILAVAYQKSGDERFAHGMVNIMTDWVKKNPPPKTKNEGDVVWTLMGVGMRCVIWASAFGIFLPSKSFSDPAKFKMLRSIFDHAQFLYLFQTNNNHLLRESNGLATIGVYFPEFHKSSEWRNAAFDRLENALIQQVNEDGSHFELSTGYQWLAIDEFQGSLDLLNAAQTKFSHADLSDYLIKMYRLLGYISRPDGSIPQLNDGFMEGNDHQLRKLAASGKEFGYQDIVYIGTRGKEGTTPAEISIGFKDAGLYVMRSDWSKEARYLIFDCGPFGGYHGHEDKLSFEVFSYGYPFIVDPGTYTYNTADSYRNYFVSSRSHNTLTIEGKSQIRRLKQKNLDPASHDNKPAQWISCKGFDYLQSDYTDGYGDYRFWKTQNTKQHDNNIEGVIHTRSILFVKPDYWLLSDKVQSSLPFNYEILFHTDQGVKFNVEQNRRVNLFRDGAYLSLIPISHIEFDIKGIVGSEAPIQGWYSNGRNHKAPAAAIIFKISCSQTATITTLIYPSMNETESINLSFNKHDLDNNETCEYIVTSSRGRDVIRISNNSNMMNANIISPANLISIQRTNPKGDVYDQWDWTQENN